MENGTHNAGESPKWGLLKAVLVWGNHSTALNFRPFHRLAGWTILPVDFIYDARLIGWRLVEPAGLCSKYLPFWKEKMKGIIFHVLCNLESLVGYLEVMAHSMSGPAEPEWIPQDSDSDSTPKQEASPFLWSKPHWVDVTKWWWCDWGKCTLLRGESVNLGFLVAQW